MRGKQSISASRSGEAPSGAGGSLASVGNTETDAWLSATRRYLAEQRKAGEGEGKTGPASPDPRPRPG